jgi:hypothetical protein
MWMMLVCAGVGSHNGPVPALTIRRHVDYVRTSSAICRTLG